MKLGELTTPVGSGVPQVAKERVRVLWASGYWDGALDGLAEFDGSQAWYCLAEEAEDETAAGWFRRFWLVRLTGEQLDDEIRRHDDFRRYVGTHFDYDEQAGDRADRMRPQTEWPKFYEKYPEDRRGPGDLSQNEVLGWFEW